METAVVLGASGIVGKAVTDALIKRNINTKILVRDIDKFTSLYHGKAMPGEVNAIQGELDNNEALAAVCEYADTIFACFNTSARMWESNMVRWIARVSDLASALQARLVYPGNLSNYSESTEELIDEESPQGSKTTKGRLSIAIENRLARSAMEGAALTILRFPDIYGPGTRSDYISQIFVRALQGKGCEWYGELGKTHDFIFSKNVGEIMVRAALEPRTADTVLHIPGPQAMPVREWIEKIYSNVTSKQEPLISVVPSWKMKLRTLWSREAAEIEDMNFLFDKTLLLDGSKYEKLVGKIRYTNHDDAIKTTLDWFSDELS
jgi:nucleoside-diphosphate-sugar epimerase